MYRIEDKVFKPFIEAEQIVEQIDRLAAEINADYSGCESVPIVVGVLNGAAIFCSDLVRKLDFEIELSFAKLSSYVGTTSTGCVKSLIGLNEEVSGRDVIIVEDIVETGQSIETMSQQLIECGAKSVKICALTFKPNCYRGSRKVDYVGFEISDEFIVGYGLDYNRKGRGLADIYVLADGE